MSSHTHTRYTHTHTLTRQDTTRELMNPKEKPCPEDIDIFALVCVCGNRRTPSSHGYHNVRSKLRRGGGFKFVFHRYSPPSFVLTTQSFLFSSLRLIRTFTESAKTPLAWAFPAVINSATPLRTVGENTRSHSRFKPRISVIGDRYVIRFFFFSDPALSFQTYWNVRCELPRK